MVVKNDLQKFLKKLDDPVANKPEKILEKVVKHGEDVAKEQYLGTDIFVTSAIQGNVGTIYARGDQVAFMEFGTGVNAIYPKDKLPKSGVPITGRWRYYYPSKYKRTLSDGRQGWFHKFEGDTRATFTTGQIAGKQMLFTAKEVRAYVHKDLAKEIK